MSTNFASLGISVESSQAVKAADDLDKLVDAAEGAEKAIDGLGKAGDDLAGTGKKITQAETEAAQGIDKSTAAIERQISASKKRGDSAAYEMAITRQLETAVAAASGSRENLSRANELYVKAQEKGLLLTEDQIRLEGLLEKAELKVESSRLKKIAAAEREAAQKQKLIDAENRQIEALKRTVNGIDPLTAKLAKLEAQENAAHEAFRRGAIDVEAYNAALAKVGKDRAGVTEVTGAFDKLKLGTRQAQENIMQLGNALSSGDWASGVRAVTQLGIGAGASVSSFLALAGPIALVTSAVGGLAYAYYKGSQEQDEFNKSLILTGNFAGTSASQLADMARQVSSTVGTTGAAADALASMAGSGKLASGSFVEIADAALSMEKATGKAVDATVAEFIRIAEDPVAAAKTLNDQYHFLTASVYSQIVALKEQGNEIGATKLLTDTYAETVQSRSAQVLNNLSLWEKAWRGIKSEASEALDGLNSLGRAKGLETKLKDAQDRLAQMTANGRDAAVEDPFRYKDVTGEISYLELQIEADKTRTKTLNDQEQLRRDAFDAQIRLKALNDSNLSSEEKRNKLIKEYKRDVEALRKENPDSPLVQDDFVAKQIQNIKDKNKDTKTAAGAVDLTAFNTSKNNLTGILSEYKNAQKELDAAQKAGLVSQADYLLKREAMIGNERDEVTAAYEAEIAALEAAKGKASTSAAQRIQLDQKIADARAAMVKAQRDADTELSVLAKNEEGRLKKQELAVKTYTSALQQQVDTLREQGMRAAAGLGQGDRQRDLTNQQNAIDDRINQQKLDLANQYGDGSRGMSLDEYTQKLQALEATQQKLHDTVVSNYDDMSAAQGDWTNGASSAWQNYLESARDVAGQTKSLFTNAFGSMEDAIVQFAMTGKLSFADFTKSILADMARIAVRQAGSSALSSLFGMAASAAGSYFGGGAASAGSTQAGYTGVDFSSYQANGGAWGAGVQMFANGGAFTNSVVSKPTAFGMAGGQTGVMGEAGPEAIVPLARTSGGQLGIRALGGDSTSSNNQVVIQQTFNIPEGSGGASEADGQVLAQAYAKSAKQGAQEQIAKDLRPGGQIYMAIRGRG
ncbi:phage tail tape measure protein [Pseudomonas protegens]|uniref:Phage tail length tape measure protein n=1 Tax=Pseudomonas protegens (strain DSM 19095 / LMG 27888 / CFBP 6595 / CHA0) TaxID=1124983 RepID=A0A2C9EPM5_PSEPH|nr:phage tail tape measure protein [Pseudomonas protegens]AGL85561.1 phage tail length tape measure protein [Pseudomonas protegens CHA0]MBP5113810.1 phage tail tape measure protein [Pseudomonas protegens]QTU23053.1 phage tail tape measure protein [Pseudomonas protegens]QTU32585.1 phage tail tape measure protein [Pseudomonas protegens]RLO19815.1 phage tail tape measure protein [Pseudomonas protegens]